MSICVIRRATAKDFKGVLDIGIVYGGKDYLPYFYHDFINDPDYLSYVCEVDGKIIGYQCGLVHDGGRVIQARAGRVNPHFQGKGYSKAMGDRMREEIAHNNNIQHLWFASSSDVINWDEVRENPDKKHLHTLKVYNFTMPRPSTKDLKPSNIICLSKTQLEAIFDCKSVCKELFPSAIIQAHYIALGLDKGNIRHIINDNTSVYAKLSNGSLDDDFEPESVSTISVGVRFWSPAGQICGISFNGRHVDELKDHIQSHIDDTPESDSITVELFVSQCFPQDALEGICKTFGKFEGKRLGFYYLGVVENKLKETMVKSRY